MVTALVRIAQGSLGHEPSGAQTPLEEQAIRYEVGGAEGSRRRGGATQDRGRSRSMLAEDLLQMGPPD